MTTFFTTAVALVAIAYLGTFINPGATPARVSLGIITILAVVTNYLALVNTLPPFYQVYSCRHP